jgi:hypothetical protein
MILSLVAIVLEERHTSCTSRPGTSGASSSAPRSRRCGSGR